MNPSDWIAIGSIALGLFVTIVGSALLLSFRIGGINEKVTSMGKSIEKLTDTTDQMKFDINEMKLDINEMQVKLDVLWTHQLSGSKSPKSNKKERKMP